MNFKKIKNKSITNSSIILLIVGLIFLIIASSFIQNIINGGQYYNDINLCKDFFSKINGNSIYFKKENGKYKPNEKLINIIETICPSKKIEINSNNDLKRVSELILNCHYEFNKGEDIFRGKFEETSICVYCGKINIKNNLNLNSPGETIIKNLKENDKYYDLITSQTSINLNENFISNDNYLNHIFKESNNLFLFYQIKSKKLDPQENIIKKTINEINSEYSEYLKSDNKIINYFSKKITEIENPPIYFLLLFLLDYLNLDYF
jgi:hypothetical protein